MNCNEHLITHWFEEIRNKKLPYKEPILDEFLVDKIKFFCDTLRQDTHVFLMTVDIVEEYIALKNAINTKITDPFLLFVTAIFICSKYNGETSDFKSSSLITLYDKLCFKKLSHRKIKMQEIDIFETLQYRLPMYTTIDDLNTFLQHYMAPYNLKFDLTYLCEELLNFFIIYKLRIFITLKVQYLQNINAINAFSSIYTNRMYIPICILLCALKITKISNVISTVKVVEELSGISKIHADHLLFLRDEIYNVWISRKKHNGLKV